MASIRLIAVTFDQPYGISIMATVKYKLSTDPDSSYITATTSATIQPTLGANGFADGGGNVVPDVVISGLVNGQTYTVQVTPNCGGTPATGNVIAGDSTTTTTTTLAPTTTTTTTIPETTTTTTTVAPTTTTTTTTEACPVIDNVDYSTGDTLT